MTTDKNEIAALRKEVAALKDAIDAQAAQLAPPEPYKPDPNWRPYDPTAGMSMPRSALQAMVEAVPDRMLRNIVMDNRNAPTGPTGMVPSSQQSPSNVTGTGTGWAHERPIGPPPGIGLIDRGVNAALPHGPEWGKPKGKR